MTPADQHPTKRPAELAAICQACHEAGQQGVPFYIVGAGLPSLPGNLADATSYAERLFDYWPIGALDPTSAAEAFTRPASAEGVEWDEGAVALVTREATGYPYFLQEFGKATWCQRRPKIDPLAPDEN